MNLKFLIPRLPVTQATLNDKKGQFGQDHERSGTDGEICRSRTSSADRTYTVDERDSVVPIVSMLHPPPPPFTFRSSTTLFTLVHKTSNLNHTLIKRKVLQRLPPDGGSRTPTQRPELLCAAESMFIFFFFQKQTTLRRLGNNNNKTARSTARLIEAVASLRTGGDSSRIILEK